MSGSELHNTPCGSVNVFIQNAYYFLYPLLSSHDEEHRQMIPFSHSQTKTKTKHPTRIPLMTHIQTPQAF